MLYGILDQSLIETWMVVIVLFLVSECAYIVSIGHGRSLNFRK